MLVAAPLLAAACLALLLRGDKSRVIYRVRGTFREARVLERWDTRESCLRRVALINDRGEAVAEAFLREPRSLAADYRILLTYAGAKTGRRILTLIPERPDIVVVAIQYPYAPPHSLPSYLAQPYAIRHAVYRTVAGGMLAVSLLTEDEGLDASRLTVLGASLGVPFAVLHGALDRRVPEVVLVHGGGRFPTVFRYIEGRKGRPALGWLEAAAGAILIDSFDPIHYVGRIAPRRVVVVGSHHDRYFPEASVRALYDRAGEPKTLLWLGSEHVSSKPTDTVEAVIATVERLLWPGAEPAPPAAVAP